MGGCFDEGKVEDLFKFGSLTYWLRGTCVRESVRLTYGDFRIVVQDLKNDLLVG